MSKIPEPGRKWRVICADDLKSWNPAIENQSSTRKRKVAKSRPNPKRSKLATKKKPGAGSVLDEDDRDAAFLSSIKF